MKKTVLLIDGGHLRALSMAADYEYTADFIELTAKKCVSKDDDLLRILYYDCKPFTGEKKKQISNTLATFDQTADWLEDLAAREKFAVRLGVLKWRGWKPKAQQINPKKELSDDDFRPDLEQKGVDLRIGLDIAVFAQNLRIERVLLMTGDTDLIPAMKHGRRGGLEVIGIELPNWRLAREIRAHLDGVRALVWPSGVAKRAKARRRR